MIDYEKCATYDKNRYYINYMIGVGTRCEIVVSRLLFYLTWFFWALTFHSFEKWKGVNVLYETKGRGYA